MNKAKAGLVLAVAFIFLASTGSATWSVDLLNSPYNQDKVSDLSSTVQILNLTDNQPKAVNYSRYKDDPAELNHIYNMTGGDRVEMKYLGRGYYYAQFEINSSKGLTTEYELLDSGSDGFERNKTEKYNLGNMTVNILSDFSGKMDPSKQIEPEIEVLNSSNGFENNATVEYYLTNVTWSSGTKEAQRTGDGFYKGVAQDYNLDFDSTYVFHATASNNSLSYDNPYGSESVAFKTSPALQGKMEYFRSDGCESDSKCEKGAEVKTALNITSSQPDNVELIVYLKNRSSGNWINNTEIGVSKNSGLYNASFNVPDINTSKFDDKLRVEFNFSNTDIISNITRDVNYRDYKVRDTSNPKAFPPTYEVRLETTRHISPEPLEEQRLNGYVNITDSDGDQFETFNISDMDYDSEIGIRTKEISIPFDRGPEIFNRKVYIENIYGENISIEGTFQVENLSESFTVGDDIEQFIEREKTYNTKLNVTNIGSGNITVEPQGEIENFTEVNNGSAIDLEEDQQEEINISFDIESVEEYDGEIKFMDNSSNYNRTVDVDLDAPTCGYKNGSFCANAALDIEADESEEEISRTFTFNYIGPEDHDETYVPEVNGNISNYAEISPDIIEVNEENSSFVFEVNYTASNPGFHSGNISIGDIEIPTTLNADFEGSEFAFSAVELLELGTIPVDSDQTKAIEIENTGTMAIKELSADSSFYNASIESTAITGGDTKELSLTLENIETGGTVDLTGSNGENSETQTVSISVTTIPDLAAKKSELSSRLTKVNNKAGPDQRSQLDGISSKIEDMETAYNQEDYEEANNLHKEITSTLDNVERQADSSTVSDTTRNDTLGETGPDTSTSNDTDSGGSNLIILVVGIVILLLIGFIVSTSIIPEKGDPFYNVLGK